MENSRKGDWATRGKALAHWLHETRFEDGAIPRNISTSRHTYDPTHHRVHTFASVHLLRAAVFDLDVELIRQRALKLLLKLVGIVLWREGRVRESKDNMDGSKG